MRVYNDAEAKSNWARAVVRAADGSETTMDPPSLHMGQLLVIKGTDVVFPQPTETFQYDDKGVTYEPGDELFITGRENSIYYPRPEHSLHQ